MKSTVNKFKRSRYLQYLAVTSAALSGFCSFTIGSWASPSLINLTSSNSPIGETLDESQASWVVAVPLLGFIMGSLIAPTLLNTIGSKWSLLSAAVPITVSWFGIAFSKSAVFLIVMRFISGIGDGAITLVLPLYIGEVADKDIRGKLTTFYPIMAFSGNVFVFSVGPFVSYITLSLLCAAVPIIFGVTFFFLPQSPYFLLRNKRLDECKNCIRSLLNNDIDEIGLNCRLEEIELTIKTQLKNKYNFGYIFSKKNFRIAMFLSLNLELITAFSGVTALKSYLQTIIGLTTSSISPEHSSIIFGVVQLPSVILAAFLVDKLGRKILLIISTLGCAITLAAEGVYFYLQEVLKTDLGDVSWLPTACLAIYLVMIPIGIVPVRTITLGEIFADDIKSFAAAISTTFTGVLVFLLSMYFMSISNAWGMYVMFWIFSVVCFYGTFFAIFILPELKGKSFIEIQEILKSRRCR